MESLQKGLLSTVDTFVLTRSDQLFLILMTYFFSFLQNELFYKEVNCTEPSPSVRVPWLVSFCPGKFILAIQIETYLRGAVISTLKDISIRYNIHNRYRNLIKLFAPLIY